MDKQIQTALLGGIAGLIVWNSISYIIERTFDITGSVAFAAAFILGWIVIQKLNKKEIGQDKEI